jgi:sugar phosphate isomerase/epimerase
MSISVAIQLYSLRNEMTKDFIGTLKKVKEMGYAGVEFAGLHGKDASEVSQALKEIGLIPVSAHVSLEEILSAPEKTMETYASIGVKYMAIPYLAVERRPESGNFAQTLSDMSFACEQAKAHGITMLYHNHDFEFDVVDGEYYLDTIYKTIPADLLQTEIDTCWVNVAGEDPAAYVIKYKGRAPIVHLKDFTMPSRENKGNLYELIGIQPTEKSNSKDGFSFRPVGYGVQDIPKILTAAENVGASWVVVEQDKPADGQTEMESAQLSRNYLKTLGY